MLAKNIELVETDKLIPYTNNPKEHPESQVKKITSSIKNYGWDQPIVVDADNEIIKGHGRLQAAERIHHKIDWDSSVPKIVPETAKSNQPTA